MVTRIDRTCKYRNNTLLKWHEKYWNFITVENPDKPWDWYWIQFNTYAKSKWYFISQEYRRYLAAYRIQQWWHRIRLDPRHQVGKKRIEREYSELFEPEAP